VCPDFQEKRATLKTRGKHQEQPKEKEKKKSHIAMKKEEKKKQIGGGNKNREVCGVERKKSTSMGGNCQKSGKNTDDRQVQKSSREVWGSRKIKKKERTTLKPKLIRRTCLSSGKFLTAGEVEKEKNQSNQET